MATGKNPADLFDPAGLDSLTFAVAIVARPAVGPSCLEDDSGEGNPAACGLRSMLPARPLLERGERWIKVVKRSSVSTGELSELTPLTPPAYQPGGLPGDFRAMLYET